MKIKQVRTLSAVMDCGMYTEPRETVLRHLANPYFYFYQLTKSRQLSVTFILDLKL